MSAPDPATHHCDVLTIDYSLVAHGSLRCAPERGGCGRTWTFVAPDTYEQVRGGWHPSPVPVGIPFRAGARRTPAPAVKGAGPW